MKTHKSVRLATLGALLACLMAVHSQAQIQYLYDAGPEGGGPANLNPELQGWFASEVDTTPGPLQNVFFLQPDLGTGFNAVLLDDQHGSGNPSPNDNPQYQIPLGTSDFQNMWDNGWEFSFRFRPIQGDNFVQWGVGTDNAVNIFGLPGRRRVGITVRVNDVDGSAELIPVFSQGATFNLGPDSAFEYHLVEAVGGPQTTQFEMFIDGASQGMFDLVNGSSNSSNDDRIGFQSGSSGGTGRAAAWNLVNLQFVPEPGSCLLLGLGAMAFGWIRRQHA